MTSTTPAAPPRPVTPLGILTAALEGLVDRAAESSTVDAGFETELRAVWALAAGLDPYLADCTTPESPALRQLVQRTHAEDWARRSESGTFLEQEMLSGHVEGQLLKFLVHAARATRVLEIGMFTGYSALAMAEALPDDGAIIACEIDPFVANFARQCFDESPSGRKIVVHVGPALDTLEELARTGMVFDFVFIDADKPGYPAYLDRLLAGDLLTPDAVICVDNTLMQGQPYGAGEPTANGSAIEAFNRSVVDDSRVEQVLLPLRDGITLIRQVARRPDLTDPAGHTR